MLVIVSDNNCIVYYIAIPLGEEVVQATVETEKVVAEMHAEFAHRRKIIVSGLPVDFTEEVELFLTIE